jgi:hypothetical protein
VISKGIIRLLTLCKILLVLTCAYILIVCFNPGVRIYLLLLLLFDVLIEMCCNSVWNVTTTCILISTPLTCLLLLLIYPIYYHE